MLHFLFVAALVAVVFVQYRNQKRLERIVSNLSANVKDPIVVNEPVDVPGFEIDGETFEEPKAKAPKAKGGKRVKVNPLDCETAKKCYDTAWRQAKAAGEPDPKAVAKAIQAKWNEAHGADPKTTKTVTKVTEPKNDEPVAPVEKTETAKQPKTTKTEPKAPAHPDAKKAYDFGWRVAHSLKMDAETTKAVGKECQDLVNGGMILEDAKNAIRSKYGVKAKAAKTPKSKAEPKPVGTPAPVEPKNDTPAEPEAYKFKNGEKMLLAKTYVKAYNEVQTEEQYQALKDRIQALHKDVRDYLSDNKKVQAAAVEMDKRIAANKTATPTAPVRPAAPVEEPVNTKYEDAGKLSKEDLVKNLTKYVTEKLEFVEPMLYMDWSIFGIVKEGGSLKFVNQSKVNGKKVNVSFSNGKITRELVVAIYNYTIINLAAKRA